MGLLAGIPQRMRNITTSQYTVAHFVLFLFLLFHPYSDWASNTLSALGLPYTS